MKNEKLRDVVNRSGFPLQIGLAHFVNATKPAHGWSVICTEHSWKNVNDGCSGFIDLVLENDCGAAVMVVEAKRVTNSSWIFLVENPRQMSRRRAKAWVNRRIAGNTGHFGQADLALDPAGPESQYCVIDGQDPKARPMLERVAADLVSSTEGFMHEEREASKGESDLFRMYFNVIITTASLKVCEVDPTNISVRDGTVGDVKFIDVPFVRFRKQLAHHYEVPAGLTSGVSRNIAQAKESTVFVVNAESLSDFLKAFEVDNASVRGVI